MQILSEHGHVVLKLGPARRKSGLNRQELEYFHLLQGGGHRHVAFEPHEFCWAPRTTYTPDFFVITKTGDHEYHEVKGHRWPASIVKFKTAANLHRAAKFYLATKKRGQWFVKEQSTL